MSASWCSWIMLGILLCAVLSEYFQPGVIVQAKNSLMAQTDRLYKESPANFMGQLLIGMFRLGTISMAMYLLCANDHVFSFKGFWVVYGLVLAVLGVKMISHVCVDYTFGISHRFGAMYEHYGNIVTLVTLILYPIVLVLLRIDHPELNKWLIGGVAVLFFILWLYRSWRQFVQHPAAIPYLIIYLCTLEIFPLALLYIVCEQTIAIL